MQPIVIVERIIYTLVLSILQAVLCPADLNFTVRFSMGIARINPERRVSNNIVAIEKRMTP